MPRRNADPRRRVHVENVSDAILVPTSGYPIGTGAGGSGWNVTMQNVGADDQAFWAVAFGIPS
jgi:hypothetical protein